MAIIRETASFDVDTKQAQRSINMYIDSLEKLEKQRQDNIRLGKSTVQVNRQIDATIKQINRSLSQTATTRKGQLAQMEATRKAQKQLSVQTQKQLLLDKKVEVQTKRNNARLRQSRRLFSDMKFLALGFAGALIAGLGEAIEAYNWLKEVLDDYVLSLTESGRVQAKVNEQLEIANENYFKERQNVNALFKPLQDDNISRDEKKKLIDKINTSYGEYLPNLLTDKTTNEQLAKAQDRVNEGLARRFALQAEEKQIAEITKKIAEINTEALKDIATANEIITQSYGKTAEGFNFLLEQEKEESEKAIRARAARRSKELADQIQDIKRATDLTVKALIEAGDLTDEVIEDAGADRVKTQAEIDQEESDRRKKELEDEQKSANRKAKIQKDLNGTLAGLSRQLAEERKKLNEDIQVSDKESLLEQQKVINQLEAEIKKLNEFLKEAAKEAPQVKIEPIEIIEIAPLSDEEVSQALQKGLDVLKISDLKAQIEQIELDALFDVGEIEKQRTEALKAVRLTEEQRDQINEQFNQKRIERERKAAREVIETQLKILSVEREVAKQAGENLTEIDKKIAKLKIELSELDAQEVTVDIKGDTDDLDNSVKKSKEILSTTIDGIEQLGSQITSFLSQQASAQLSQLESDVARQQAFLSDLLNNQAGANAQQVQLERDRLDALVAQRKKAQERQAAIATAEIALNLAIGVARAAAEGGGIGSAFTIAALILAAGIGFLQARQQAQQAFATGTDYVHRGKGEPSGTDTVHAMLDEGEAVIQKDRNKEYHPTVKAIRRGEIPAKDLNQFVKGYKKGAKGVLYVPSFAREMQQAGINFNMFSSGMDSKLIEKLIVEQKQTRKAIEGLPVQRVNITERGLTKTVTSHQNDKAVKNNRFK